jgi:hypothetical protein
VLALRAVEFAALGAVAALVLLAPAAMAWTPLALALGPVLAAFAVRRLVVVPRTRATAPAPALAAA